MAYEIDFMASYDCESIAAELRRVAKLTGKQTLSANDVDRFARVSASTVQKKFGSLRQAHEAAGLVPAARRRWKDEELLRIVTELWAVTLEETGRRPTMGDVRKHGLPLAATTIAKRFGSWRNALLEGNAMLRGRGHDSSAKGKPLRSSISVRTRFLVFKRDRYRCVLCGRSGVELEVDHAVPVSHGGSSHPSNLQTLCFECNRGKRNSPQ